MKNPVLRMTLLCAAASCCFGQAMVEHSAAAAVGTAGSVGGKAISNGLDKVFGRVAANENTITKDNPMANGKGMESGLLPVPTTVPVTEIPKLLEQAENVQKIAEERMKQMEGMAH